MSTKHFFVSLSLVALLVPAIAVAQDSTEPAKPETQPAVTTQAKPETVSPLTVEAKLCTGVVDRVAQGEATRFSSDIGEIYLWCRVIGAKDSTHVEHLWYYKGEEKASIKLPINGASWRTWSKKTIMPHWTGQWEVKIVDADWRVLKTLSFTIEQPGPPTEE